MDRFYKLVDFDLKVNRMDFHLDLKLDSVQTQQAADRMFCMGFCGLVEDRVWKCVCVFLPFQFRFQTRWVVGRRQSRNCIRCAPCRPTGLSAIHTCSVMFALGLPRCPYISVSISAECLDPLGREHRLPALFLSASVTAALHHLLVCSIHYSIAWIGSLCNSISTSLFKLFSSWKTTRLRFAVDSKRC